MTSRAWTREAVRIIDADFNRSADTHLLPLRLKALLLPQKLLLRPKKRRNL